jgi:hypothetical protein
VRNGEKAERTLKGVLLAGLLSGGMAQLHWLFGWPRLSWKLSMAMTVFFFVALLGITPFVSGSSE